LPEPLAPERIVIQLTLLTAVQAHPSGAVTLTVACPPLAGKERPVGKMEKEQLPGVGVGVGVGVAVGVGVGVAVGVGVGVEPKSEQRANSEVLPFGSVAVAVMKLPERIAIGKVTAKLARQPPFVVTVVEPMSISPSPKPEGSQAALEKNSIVNVMLGVLFSVPSMVVVPPALLAEVMTGVF
jgi:hypothetical protein